MKKMLLLLASVLVLTACTQPKKEAKEATASKTEQTTKASSSAKEEKGLKFVGDQGDITVYYTGNTYTVEQQEYAVFMLVNKTTTNIDHDATFKISWSYDG